MKNTVKNFGNYSCYALITGAASGMGQKYALRLASMGYNLLLVDIDGTGLEQTRKLAEEEVGKINDWRKAKTGDFRVTCIVQDLSVQSAASDLSEKADALGCDVAILVNNAGMFFFRETAEVPQKYISRMMMLHNYTPLMLCREFVPKMKSRGKGYVLNISSLAAWMPWPGVGMYGNTKRFIKGFSRSLRIECMGSGVSVTAAYFGAVDTGLFGLPPAYRKLARRLGVMVSADRAVDSALRAMFGKRRSTMPGLVNHLFRPLLPLMPDRLLHWLYRRLEFVWTKF